MAAFIKRQSEFEELPAGWVVEDGHVVPWWYTRRWQEGIIVKWTLLLSMFVLVFGYVIGGYWHAKRRMRKGLQPLAYHRCLVARKDPPQYDSRYRTYTNYRQTEQAYVPPPPVYDPNRPPMYEGPGPDYSKVDPSQMRTEPTRRPAEMRMPPEYEAPPGPPPAVTR
ncbi:hypothetical protein B0I35DRAFT_501381 [Stachybotrys elegans]|uniref:Uncharacterized protein n=1 Tax=Stachybotrys elegans TaxID=80388 RepID=A0A8K0SW60_9HYPO|nr:hypothetical protein B0I35DRAFT_501381 [Stachybotrys elegans]